MADCTIRRRDESWVEVVLPSPTIAGEMTKAHHVMLHQLGLEDASLYDDVYEVVAMDDELVLRAKVPVASVGGEWGSLTDGTAIHKESYRRGVQDGQRSRSEGPPGDSERWDK